MASPRDLLTVPAAAALIGVHRSVALRAIHRGRLHAFRVGPRAWLVQRQEAERYRDSDRRPGPKPRKGGDSLARVPTVEPAEVNRSMRGGETSRPRMC